MKKGFRAVGLLAAVACLSGLASIAAAAEADLEKKVEALGKEVESLRRQLEAGRAGGQPAKGSWEWLSIGGDFRFRVDSLRGKGPVFWQFAGFSGGAPNLIRQGQEFTVKNDILYTNRFGLNIRAKATRNVSFTGRLLMYKTWGSSDAAPTSGMFFADRVGVFDGTAGHVPGDGKLTVDQAYVTWTNILDKPVWFSVGRRPSTGGIPSHLRQNAEKPGNAGIPALLVDYAFDGMTLGVAPDIEALPGAYAKICYGRGHENGFTSPFSSNDNLKDTDMIGLSIVPVDIDPLYVNLQWNRGMNIFDSPVMKGSALGDTRPSKDLGDIDWYGLTVQSTLKKTGPGTLNAFASAGLSKTHPNGQTVVVATDTGTLFDTGAGLMFTGRPESKTGWAFYAGGRYDIAATRTKLGLEYNHGSKDWITFVPAGDDIWTSKLGTRGNVYEAYLIQEFDPTPVSSHLAKAFFRLGYQYYDFDYTGSNNWVGAPVKIGDLDNMMVAQMLTPLKNARDLYATMEVRF